MKKTISEINPLSKIAHPTLSFPDCIEQASSPKIENGNIGISKQSNGFLEIPKADLFLNYKKFLDDCMTKSFCEGKVVGYNKRGLYVEIYGILTCMPRSQIEICPQDNLDVYLNQTITFNLISFKTKNFGSKEYIPIISHRNVIETAISKQEVKGFSVGDKIKGVVTSITAKCATVKVTPFLSGKIHLQQDSLSGSPYHPQDIRIGKTISTEILNIDDSTSDKAQLILSLPISQPSPWSTLEIEPGDIVEGKVKSCLEIGTFLELPCGVEGLIPTNEYSWDTLTEHYDFKTGKTLHVRVLTIDKSKKRLILSLKQFYNPCIENKSNISKVGDITTCTVCKVTENGLVIQTILGSNGFISKHELDTKSHCRLKDFRIGDILLAKIIRLDTNQHKMFLSNKLLNTQVLNNIEQAYPIGTRIHVMVINRDSTFIYVRNCTNPEVYGFFKISKNNLAQPLTIGEIVNVQIVGYRTKVKLLELQLTQQL